MNETQKRHMNWAIAMEHELQDRACRCQEEADRSHDECVAEARRAVREQMGPLS